MCLLPQVYLFAVFSVLPASATVTLKFENQCQEDIWVHLDATYSEGPQFLQLSPSRNVKIAKLRTEEYTITPNWNTPSVNTMYAKFRIKSDCADEKTGNECTLGDQGQPGKPNENGSLINTVVGFSLYYPYGYAPFVSYYVTNYFGHTYSLTVDAGTRSYLSTSSLNTCGQIRFKNFTCPIAECFDLGKDVERPCINLQVPESPRQCMSPCVALLLYPSMLDASVYNKTLDAYCCDVTSQQCQLKNTQYYQNLKTSGSWFTPPDYSTKRESCDAWSYTVKVSCD